MQAMNNSDSKIYTQEREQEVEHHGRATGSGTNDIDLVESPSDPSRPLQRSASAPSAQSYKVYKRRFFGLGQLVLLNIVVSWDWLSFAANSKTTAQYYGVTEGAINWLSTGFLFAFCVASPVGIYILNRAGPRGAIVATACCILVGNWVRYGGTRAGKNGNFGVVVFGQILIGFAQPFCLSAPTRYSDMWFTDRGRIAATAVASLANPFGGALGELIDPSWGDHPSDIPNMVLYISIISTVACIPSFFVPAGPPTPPSPVSLQESTPIRKDIRRLFRSLEFWLVFIPFSIYVAFFNSFSSLINQLLEPYGFSEDQAGIAGAILIVVGLVFAAVTSPICDRFKIYLLLIKIFVPFIAVCYLIFVFAPPTHSLAFVYVICAILGACSFGLLPVALEYLVEITYPVSPEVSSTICWFGGQLLGGIFIVIQNALKGGDKAHPPRNMHRALVFEAVLAAVAVPFPLCIGLFGLDVRHRRLEAERTAADGAT